MKYPQKLSGYEEKINGYLQLKTEMGCIDLEDHLLEIAQWLGAKVTELAGLQGSASREAEPDTLEAIREASESSGSESYGSLDDERYFSKLKGAIIGRFAGCALGAPVELLTLERLEQFAEIIGMPFPPQNYWLDAPSAYVPRYEVAKAKDFTLGSMRELPPDDDIMYTLISMLVMERYGRDFTTEDVGKVWQELLPIGCTYTAERQALNNMNAGISWEQAGEYMNPDQELIGAAIRCDGWAYVHPLDPLRATEFAYRDAFLSHRRSGIYSAVYFAATISLAFSDMSLEEVFMEALHYIPRECEFAGQVCWAIEKIPAIRDFRDAHRAVSERFSGMNPVHAVNNACLTIWGTMLGKDSFTDGISQTVAMAYDNDCTAATVGSILGAHHGIDAIPEYWYAPWNNTIRSYLKKIPSFRLDDCIGRFFRLKKMLESRA